MIDKQKLYKAMDGLGYRESLKGTEFIRQAAVIMATDRRAMMTKDVYPAIARAAGISPARVERAMRTATGAAMRSPGWGEAWRELGGWNHPTNAEVCARLARECDDEN